MTEPGAVRPGFAAPALIYIIIFALGQSGTDNPQVFPGLYYETFYKPQ